MIPLLWATHAEADFLDGQLFVRHAIQALAAPAEVSNEPEVQQEASKHLSYSLSSIKGVI